MGTEQQRLLLQAQRLVSAGISVLPIKTDGTKRPDGSCLPFDEAEQKHVWAPYKERLPNTDELESWWGNGCRRGIAIIGGRVSGNLEILDFDEAEKWEEFKPLIEAEAPGLLERLIITQTPRPGYQLIYRCEAPVDGNLKLARGLRPDPERGGDLARKTLIETRGEAGYAVAAGSPAEVHETRRPYTIVQGDLAAPPVVTVEERQTLLRCARALNEYTEPAQQVRPSPQRSASAGAGLRPGDDFNRRGDLPGLLERHGWTLHSTNSNGSRWCRPGKDSRKGISATLGIVAPGIFYVFSSNADPFDSEQTYDAFGVYALLEHGGDFAAATRALAAQGYGEPGRPARRSAPAPVVAADGASFDPFTEDSAIEDSAEPGEGTLQAGLERALEAVRGLAERAKEDPAALADPTTLDALAFLQVYSLGDWLRTYQALKQARLPREDVRRAVTERARRLKVGRSAAAASGIQESPGAGRRAGDSVEDAPAPHLIIPDPYFVRANATGRMAANEDGEPEARCFAGAPVLIAGKLRDADEGTEALRLTWRRPNGWREMTVDRGVALDGRRIVSLASSDFPVSSSNAKEMVSYLDGLETANYAQLPCARVSSHLGWQGKEGEAGFLWGRNLILPSGEKVPVALDELAPADWREDLIAFRGLAEGDEQLAAGFHANGTFEGWRNAVSPLANYPRSLIAFYAAFVPPLLKILRVPNFIVDLANRTSTGKTTSLRAAASVWGNADERTADAALWTWDATRVFVERSCAVVSGLPLILDDTKRAKDPRLVASIIYALTSGQGRGRGNTTSLTRTRTWQTVLISSGEAPAVSFTNDGGTRTRVLEIRGTPFGRDDQETRRVVDQINVGVVTNYGHAGPAFVQWLQQNNSRWEEFRAMYARGVEHYSRSAPSAEGGRLAQYAAVLALAARLAHEAVGLPWEYRDPLATLWAGIASEAAEASGELRALRDVISWAYSHKETFFGRHQVGSFDREARPPSQGWSGRWDREEGWEFVAFYPHLLEKILAEREYSPEAILSGWQERGWLDSEKGRRDKKIGFDGAKPRCVVIRRAAIEEVEGPDAEA